jgi:hypothetical protein
MNAITLQSDGRIEHEGTIVCGAPLNFLSAQIRLGTAYCLRSYFAMFEVYGMLVDLNEFIPTQLTQYRQCTAKDCLCDAFSHLEFTKTVEMIGFPEKRLEIYTAIKGVCGDKRLEIKPYGFESLLDLPVKLGGLKHLVFGDRVDAFEFDTVFTLFEFIDGIAWELSFHVMPEHCQIGFAQKE